MKKSAFRKAAQPVPRAAYPTYHAFDRGRRDVLLLIGASLLSASSLGAYGGCLPPLDSRLDQRVPDAGHDLGMDRRTPVRDLRTEGSVKDVRAERGSIVDGRNDKKP
jgi:hypothetical protein